MSYKNKETQRKFQRDWLRRKAASLHRLGDQRGLLTAEEAFRKAEEGTDWTSCVELALGGR